MKKIKIDQYITIECEQCHKICDVYKRYKGEKSRFCSLTCFWEYKYHFYIKAWIMGKVTGGRKEGYGTVSNFVKRWVWERANSKCEKCGWSETNIFTNTIPLEIHHIDGDSENHKPENLELLCPNCHSLTSSHSSSKGNGRRYYRELYLAVPHYDKIVSCSFVDTSGSLTRN